MNNKKYFVYIMTNTNRSALYIGGTSNLYKRRYEHKTENDEKSFTKKYNLNKLVYYEIYENPVHAIAREKQLKKWKGEWKQKLIKKANPYWKDLFEELE